MRIQRERLKTSSLRLVTATRTAFFLLAALTVSIIGLFNSHTAGATQTTAQYCSQYTTDGKLNACKAGIEGQDCSDYVLTYDQETADVCIKSTKAKADGLVSDTTPSPSPSPTSTDAQTYKNAILDACSPYQNDSTATQWCLYGGLGQNGTATSPISTQTCLSKKELQGSSTNQGACITGSTAGQTYLNAKNGTDTTNNGTSGSKGGSSGFTNPFQVQDLLDQTNNLSQYLDILHATGQDSKIDLSKADSDNNPAYYINGAGQHQAINVTPSGVPNSPAIIFFNGGAWHGNDKTSVCVAEGSPKKNCVTGTNSGNDNIGPPAGGGATARGYTVFDATYRLGSSGVYYMFEDVMRAIQHIRNNAAIYGIDPSKIAIFGDSAGGSLSMRAAASGKSGAKAAVGWSPPTNAYTGLFHSLSSFLIGMDHSTCIPTDLAGITNLTSLLSGGSGNVAQYGQGLSSNGFDAFGLSSGGSTAVDPIGVLTSVLIAGQYAAQTGQNIESISQQLQSGGIQGMTGSLVNLSAQKLTECIDNFNVLSPALFASPDTPPSFLGGIDNDNVVGPEQVTGMRDKLRSMGIRSESLIIQGDPTNSANTPVIGASDNHLGYDPRFVCPTLNFLDSILQPDKGQVDCVTGARSGGSGGGGASTGGGSGGGVAIPSGGNVNGTPQSSGNLGAGNCPQGYVVDSSGGCRVADRSSTPNGSNLNPGNCPQGYVIDSSGGCRVIDHSGGTLASGLNTTVGAPGAGTTFNLSPLLDSAQTNDAIAANCPSGHADSISNAGPGGMWVYRCR